MEALFNIPSVPPKEKGRMASLPNSVEIFLKREMISPRASSHEIRCHSCWCGEGFSSRPDGAKLRSRVEPFGPTRRIGYKTRSGEYTRSRYLATLAHRKPRVTGCA